MSGQPLLPAGAGGLSGPPAAEGLVVLLDEAGRPAGTAPKSSVHTDQTPLHLAFSCYVLRGDHMLVTRRATSKSTWPGIWTNACCGHPAPGELPMVAVLRRLSQELGLKDVAELRLAHADFRYRAVMDNGVVENEICPVYVARVTPEEEPKPDSDEVMEYRWTTVAAFRAAVRDRPQDHSPWAREQLEALCDDRALGV